MEKSAFTPLAGYFRERLVSLRKAAGLTQRGLAKRLGRVQTVVARIEQGERRLDVIEFYWLCKACKADPEKVGLELLRAFKAIEAEEGKKERQRQRLGRGRR